MFAHGFGEAVDGTAAWILIGIGIAAWLLPNLDPDWLAELPRGLEVPIAALMGLPIYVCASGSTPLVAVLVAKGLSPGAALAFLLTGPATNVTTFGVVRSMHGKTAGLVFATAVGAGAIALGYLVDLLLPPALTAAAELRHDHTASWLESVSLAVLTVLFLASVLRRGVRGFLAPLFDAPTLAEWRRHPASPADGAPPHACCKE